MTREEHIVWAKERALDQINKIDGLVSLSRFVQDLRSHPSLENHEGIETAEKMLMSVNLPPVEEIKKWIEDFS